MASIYDLTADIQLLWNLMEEGKIDDDTLIDAMKNSQEELSIKLEGYCKFIKNMEADIEAYKKEEKRLANKRNTLENTVERAKKAMQFALDTAGEKKVPCGIFTVSVQKNPSSLVMDDDDIEHIPAEYLIAKDPVINTKKIKEELTEGATFPFAHLTQTESLRIR